MTQPGTRFVHWIDADDVITFVNEDWAAFAAANGGPAPAEALGVSLWSFVSGRDVQELWRRVLDRVRGGRRLVRFPYRCDSPERRRELVMEVSPAGGGGVEFLSRLLREEARDAPAGLLLPHPAHGDWTIHSCSWCRRFRTWTWVEVEEAIRELGLFDESRGPAISHGICDDCRESLLAEL